MVYLPTGSSDLFLILSCMTSNFLCLSFSTLHSSSLWRTDTIVWAKLNKPSISISLLSNVFEIIEDLRYYSSIYANLSFSNLSCLTSVKMWVILCFISILNFFVFSVLNSLIRCVAWFSTAKCCNFIYVL